MVVPRALYGCELAWRGNFKQLAITERTFLRRVLRLPDSAYSAALYSETGLLPITVMRDARALSFFIYAITEPAPPLVRRAALANLRLHLDGHHSWMGDTLDLASSYGLDLAQQVSRDGLRITRDMAGLRDDEDIGVHDLVRRYTSKTLNAIRAAAWQQILAECSATTVLRYHRPACPRKALPYLACLSIRAAAPILRLRFGSSPLAVDRARFAPRITPRRRRVCRLCNSLEMEDIEHLLGACELPAPLHASREVLLAATSSPLGGLDIDQLLHSNDADLLVLLSAFLECLYETLEALPIRIISDEIWDLLVEARNL